MHIRKNAHRLPQVERERYVNTVKALKSDIVSTLADGTRVSRYDQLVAMHLGVTTRFANQEQLADGGHRGPAFLPWHRQYLQVLEEQMRQVDSEATIPYWDWTDRNGTASILFQDNFIGPRGQGPGGRVLSGPFTRDAGWELIPEIHRHGVNAPTLGRDLLRGTFFDFSALPSQQRINEILALDSYEDDFFGRGFRRELEVDPHNILHGWISGTMGGMSSPNDPVFFLHHCAVDRYWAEWQDDGHSGFNFYPTSAPDDGAGRRRIGHGLQQPMWPWDGGESTTLSFLNPYLPTFSETVRPADVLDFRSRGFIYDTLLPLLSAGQTINNIDIGAPGDELGFRIAVQSAGNYRIETHGITDTVLRLYGPGNWDFIVQDNNSGSGANAMIVANLSPGTYFAVVRHASPTGTGRFSISLQAEIIDETVELTLNGPAIQASIGSAGEQDAYRFSAPTLGEYTIETQGPTDVFMSLYGPNNNDSLVVEDDDSGQDRNARINSQLTAGDYRVEIRHYFPTGTGLYSISVRSEQDITPNELAVDGAETHGEIGVPNESDLYTFRATVEGVYTIETSGSTDTFLSLFGPDSETTLIAQDDDSGPGLLSRIEIALLAGTYYVRVRHYSPFTTGPYGVRVRRS